MGHMADELRHENRRLLAEVARLRAEVAVQTRATGEEMLRRETAERAQAAIVDLRASDARDMASETERAETWRRAHEAERARSSALADALVSIAERQRAACVRAVDEVETPYLEEREPFVRLVACTPLVTT